MFGEEGRLELVREWCELRRDLALKIKHERGYLPAHDCMCGESRQTWNYQDEVIDYVRDKLGLPARGTK